MTSTLESIDSINRADVEAHEDEISLSLLGHPREKTPRSKEPCDGCTHLFSLCGADCIECIEIAGDQEQRPES